MKRRLAVLPLLLLYATHVDVWNWHDSSLVFGLPIGLTYHVAACVLAVGALAALVRWAWPEEMVAAAERGAAETAASPGEMS